jgi:glycosyltransferase involved in cell wall biosynthesis
MPLYRGADLVGKALECLQRQTFRDFEVIISVDGNDDASATACRPFLDDPRFRMVVHAERLDWVGNFNWLLRQDLKEFFCYRQHDDTTSPDFFEILLKAAEEEPQAAAVYCDCQLSGASDIVQVVPSVEGEPLHRIFEYISRLPNIGPPVPARGLIRSAAIRQAGVVRSDEFRAAWQIFGWLTKLLAWGSFRRVPRSLYNRLDHPESYTRAHWNSAHRAAYKTMFTALLEAAMQSCKTPAEREFFQVLVLERVAARPPFELDGDAFVGVCLERLAEEGNGHLLTANELPSVLGQLRRAKAVERLPWGDGLLRCHWRYRLGRLLYPNSPGRRIEYLVRQLHRGPA